MNSGSKLWSVIALLLAAITLNACVDPRGSLAGHSETQGATRRIGVISDLGDTITYVSSGGIHSVRSTGDISTWNVDGTVVDLVRKSLSADSLVSSVQLDPKAFDDIADITIASELHTPEVISRPDPAALRAKIASVLGPHSGEEDFWIIFRKASAFLPDIDQSLVDRLTFRNARPRLGISIVHQDGNLGIVDMSTVALEVFGRVTIVDGKTLEPIADAPLVIRSPGGFLDVAHDVTPFWILRKEFLVENWDAYTPAQQDQIHTTLNLLLADAVTQTLNTAGLSIPSQPPSGE